MWDCVFQSADFRVSGKAISCCDFDIARFANRDFAKNFLLKTKNSLWLYRCISSALPSPYISSILCLNASASQGLVLFSMFLLYSVYRRSSSQFQVTILHDPSLNLWYRFGLLAICWFTLFELKILEFKDLLLLLLLEKALSVSQIALHCCTIWNLYLPSCKRCLKEIFLIDSCCSHTRK